MRVRLLSFLLLTFVPAFAQSDRGTITGTVADPAGAVIANAPVQAKNTETGVVYMAQASTTGNFTIAQLPVGTYELSVTVPGFKKWIRPSLTVEVAQVLRVDAQLEVGSSTESVTVTAEAPLLDTETGDLRHSVTVERLNDLPVLGIGAGQAGSAGIRNPDAMIELVPGTLWQPNAEVRINGTPNNTQSFRIEGQDASNTGTPGVPAQTQPSVDSIQEIAIQTSNYAAEYGQVGGGYINITMRSGTNQFHGSAYDYFVNEVFNGGTPDTDARAGTGNPRPRNRRNDYGFTLGGPVWIPKVYNGHNKTFFFFNWEQYREHVAINTQLETVPTAAYRLGNFSSAEIGNPIGTDPLGRPIYQNEIYDPSSTFTDPVSGKVVRNPFPGNTIPSTAFDPLAVKVQSLFPAPMGPNASGLVNNYVPNIPTSRVTQIPSVKIDQVIGNKGKLAFFYELTKTTAPLSFTFGNVDGLPDPLATNLGTFQNAPLYRLNYDYTLAPTVLLHFGGGYRSNYFFVPTVNEEGQVPNFNATAFGFKGGLTNQFFPPIGGLCTPGPTTGSCVGQGGMQSFGSAAYAENITQVPSFNTNVTWVKDNHTYKFGAEFRTEGYPAISRANSSGSYTFAADQTSLPYLNGTTLSGLTPGFGYASFLLGDVKTVSIANPVDPRLGKKQFGIYAQDSWKITRKITFDYGLRYDYSTYLQEQYGRAPFFSPTTPNPALGGILGAMEFDRSGAGHCNCNIAKNYPFAAAPRLGLAYQFLPKTVLRAGFGIVYAGTEANNNAVPGIAGSSATVTTPSFGLPVTTLSAGIPASYDPAPWPNLNPSQFNIPSAPGVYPPVSIAGNPFIDPNAGRPARQYQWSIGIQRELMANLAVDVSYVGNRGIWWQSPVLENLNATPLGTLAAHGLSLSNPATLTLLTDALSAPAVQQAGFGAPYPGFPTNQTLAQALRPFPQFTTINTYWDPLGDTWYNSMQVKATKRVSHNLSFVSTFAWQKSQDTGVEIGEPNPGTTGGAVVNDVFNRKIDKYLSTYDQPFIYNISLSYTTPRIGFNKALSWVARDWTYGAFLQYSSGFPIEAPLATNNLSSDIFQSTFADRVSGQPLFTHDLNCHCFDPNATFVLNPAAWTNPPAGQFGTSAAYYSDYRTQRRPVESMNLGREWRIKERYRINVRIEFTNIFNRTYVANPTSTNALAPQVRVLTGQTAGNTASGFGYINTQSYTPQVGPRNGVLVARFSF
jgi:hypothetical protein